MNKSMLIGAVASGRRRGGILPPGTHTMTVSSNISDWNVNLPYIESTKAKTSISGVPNLLEFRGSITVVVGADGSYSVAGGTMQLVGYMPVFFKGGACLFWFWDGVTSTLTIPGWASPTQTLNPSGRGTPTGPPTNAGPVLNQGFLAFAAETFPEPVSTGLSDPDAAIFGSVGRRVYDIPIAGIPLNSGVLQPDGSIVIPLRGVPSGDLSNHPTEGITDAVLTTKYIAFDWAFYMSGTITLTKR